MRDKETKERDELAAKLGISPAAAQQQIDERNAWNGLVSKGIARWDEETQRYYYIPQASVVEFKLTEDLTPGGSQAAEIPPKDPNHKDAT